MLMNDPKTLHLENEPDYINLLLGIQNVQMEMMHILQTLQENVSAIRHEILMRPIQEEAAPCLSIVENKSKLSVSNNDDSDYTTNNNSSVFNNPSDDVNVRFFLEFYYL